MSGGHFNYKQYEIGHIADDLERYILKCENKVPKDWGDEDENGKYTPYINEEPEEILNRMKEGLSYLRKAYIFVHEIDYYLSGDTGPESFHKRLEKELAHLALDEMVATNQKLGLYDEPVDH